MWSGRQRGSNLKNIGSHSFTVTMMVDSVMAAAVLVTAFLTILRLSDENDDEYINDNSTGLS